MLHCDNQPLDVDQGDRMHCGIENRLHRALDVAFDEDHCRLPTGHGPQNMAIFRHIAMNPIRASKAKSSLWVRLNRAGWNTGYLGDILAGNG